MGRFPSGSGPFSQNTHDHESIMNQGLTFLILLMTGLLCGLSSVPAQSTEGACVSIQDAASQSSPDTMAQGGFIAPPATTLMGKKPEARWIWDAGEINPRNTYLQVRKAFDLKEVPVSAVTYVSAHAFAELYVNGVHVDQPGSRVSDL